MMKESKRHDRIWAEVNLDAVTYNVESMHKNIAPGTRMIGVLKADGYGHGSIPLARTLEDLPYMFGFATATFEEAESLRKSGITKPILILGYTFPYCYEDMIRENIRPAIFRLDTAKEFAAAAAKIGRKAKVHVAVDTGMSRIGITPDDAGLSFVKGLMSLPEIQIEGIFTHFAKADMAGKDAATAQYQTFKSFTDRIETELGLHIPIRHCCNSAGIIRMPEADMDAVRAGITIYGLWPSDEVERNIVDLKPALSLRSHIVYIKELGKGKEISYGGTYVADHPIRVATIPVGYADGYPRSLSGKGYVLIQGKKAPILGRICMDQMMVDVSGIPEAKENDEVTLIGRSRDEVISAEYLGDLSGRFNYELVCDIGKRVPREYIHSRVACSV